MYKYIKHSDGKTLAVNTTTGEVSDTFNATLPVGSMTFTPEQQKNYHKQKQKERARQEQTLNRNPSRSFYFLKNNNEFNELKAADVARLIVLATYIRYDRDSNKDNKLLLDTGEPLTIRDIPYLLKISEKTAKRFINNVTPKYLKITDTGLLFTNHFYFCKGRLNANSDFRKVYNKNVRKLYNSTQHHNHIGYIFSMLQYVNVEYNILCTNPEETDIDLIQPLSFTTFCQKIGYDTKAEARLKRIYHSIKFNVNGKDEKLVDIGNRIIINPKILYSGTDYKKVEVLGLFYKDVV